MTVSDRILAVIRQVEINFSLTALIYLPEYRVVKLQSTQVTFPCNKTYDTVKNIFGKEIPGINHVRFFNLFE